MQNVEEEITANALRKKNERTVMKQSCSFNLLLITAFHSSHSPSKELITLKHHEREEKNGKIIFCPFAFSFRHFKLKSKLWVAG